MALIAQAAVADWRRTRDVRLRALGDTPDAFGSTLNREITFTDEEWRRRLARTDAATFLASIGGADVGIVVAAPNEAGDASIYAMWVAPEARGKGVGDALVAAAVAWARERGFKRITLGVTDANPAAAKLYARHGFAPTGVTGTLPAPRTHIAEHELALNLT